MKQATWYVNYQGYCYPDQSAQERLLLLAKVTVWGPDKASDNDLKEAASTEGVDAILHWQRKGGAKKALIERVVVAGFGDTPTLNLHPQGSDLTLLGVLSQRVAPTYGG